MRSSKGEVRSARSILAESWSRRYVAAVTSLRCSQCGAELMPDGKFCRRCGLPATDSSIATDSSELPTEMLDERANLTTSRLQPRTTSPETPMPRVGAGFAEKAASAPGKSRRFVVIGSAIVVLLICGILASVAYVTLTNQSSAGDDAMLFYPGARTIADVLSADGRAIQLQTDDPLEKVIAWYENSIKPTKTMRLTANSIVLKNQKVTTTLASEAGKTSILIKKLK